MSSVVRAAAAPPRLRGREPELAQLEAAMDAITAGRGGVVLISGAAGAGKTSLLDETVALARARGVRVLRSGCEPAAQAVPLGPLLDALVGGATPFVERAAVKSLTRSPDQRFWLLCELQERLERAAHRAPLMWAIDDLQWADAATLGVLTALSRRLAAHRVLWLISVRDPLAARLARDAVERLSAGATRLALAPLDDSAVASVASDMLGAQPDERLLDALARVEGHPFLLVELLRGLRDERHVEIADRVARLTGTGVPLRVVDVVEQQVGRLSDDARHALRMAAVLGRRFSAEALAALAMIEVPLLVRAIDEVVRAGLLVQDGERLGFRHDLVHEALAATLPPALRAALRRRALSLMLEHGAPPAEVAALALEVARPGDAAAIEVLRRAAADIGDYAPLVAAPLSRRALDLMSPGDRQRGTRVLETVHLFVRAGQPAEALKVLAAASQDLSDPPTEARARLNIGILSLQYDAAATIEQCRSALRHDGLPALLRVHCLVLTATALDLLGEPSAAGRPALEALAVAEGEPAARALPLIPLAVLWMGQGAWRKALLAIDDACTMAIASTAEAPQLWLPDAWRALLLLAVARLDDASRLIDAGQLRAQRDGLAVNVRVWSMVACRAQLARGRLADARTEAEAILDMTDELGEAGGYISDIAVYALGCVALHTGGVAALAQARSAALRLLHGELEAGRRLGAWLAARLAAIGAHHGTGTPLRPELLDPLIDGMIPVTSPRACSDAPELARLLLRAGDRAAAITVAERIERLAEIEPDFPFLRASAVHTRAVVEEDAELALEAVELHRHDPRPLVRAAAHEDAGRLLGRTRDRLAIGLLDEALALYAAAGADLDASRTRGRLRERGARRGGGRSRAAPEWPSLTPSELAVARLVAAGATNREVAEQLFISTHTVNSHLRHAFGKLGIRSRVELARMLADRANGDAIE